MIHGAFTIANVSEWAVVCSVREISQILIYQDDPSGTARVVDSLERSPNAAWMQGIGGGRQGYSRLIQTRQRRRLSGARVDADGKAIPQPIDHDAIEQVFLEKASQGFYFAKGRWYRQVFAD